MTTQELHAALHISAKIRRLEAQQEDMRQSFGRAPEVRVQGGRGVSAAQIAADLSEEIAKLLHELEIEQAIIRRYIDRCSLDELERKIMLLRYVECYPWEMVCKAVGYSPRRVYQIHSAAKRIADACSPSH